MKRIHILTTSCLLMASGLLAAQSSPPSSHPPPSYQDAGVCPFECCRYQQWVADDIITLLESPDHSADVVTRVPSAERVEGLTGLVRTTTPGKVKVVKAYTSDESHRHYRRGDMLSVYTYLGEGFFKIWFAGEFYTERLLALLHNNGGWVRCAEEKTCPIEVIQQPESVWWVKVRSRHGLIGWTHQSERFSNMGSCG